MQVILHRSEGVNRTRTRRQSPAHAALTGERRQGRVEWDCCTRSNASLVSTPVAPGRKPGSRTGCAVPIAVGAASSLSATFADGTPSAINGCFRTGKATSTTEPRRARRASGPAQARQSHALLLKLPEPRVGRNRARCPGVRCRRRRAPALVPPILRPGRPPWRRHRRSMSNE